MAFAIRPFSEQNSNYPRLRACGYVPSNLSDREWNWSSSNARATAAYARNLASTTGRLVTLLPTEGSSQYLQHLGEDSVCADYLEALLREQENASALLADNLTLLEASGRFDFLKQGDVDFPFEDIALIKGVDRFDFVMVGHRKQADGFDYVEVERHDVV